MSKKVNVEELFVACPIVDYIKSTTGLEQCGPQGSENHQIYINPKKILVIKKENKYFDAVTGLQVRPYYYKCSYYDYNDYTRDNKIYRDYKMPKHIPYSWRSPKLGYTTSFSYVIPFKEYIKKTLNIDVEDISLIKARILLSISNLSCEKPFKLSYDENVAQEQIREKVLRR